MYELEKIKVVDLKKLTIENQSKIVELTGSEFKPQKAYELIKSETESFSKELSEAKKADELFTKLLKKQGILPSDKSLKSKETTRIKIKEKERKRRLKLLELKLKLARTR